MISYVCSLPLPPDVENGFHGSLESMVTSDEAGFFQGVGLQANPMVP